MAGRWYCVQSYPRKEFFARSNLRRLGFQTFMPTETCTRRYRNNVKKELLLPLFGSYMFVRFDVDEDHWRPIVSAYGIRRLFSSAPELPTPIPDHTIDSLMQCVVEPGEPNELPVIHPNCRAKVVAGPFASARGEQSVIGLCTATKGQRAKLLLDTLRGAITIEFDIASLELVA